MKKFSIGLIVILLLNGLVYFMLVPKLKSESYDNGYKKGMQDGALVGDAQGRATQKKLDDSLAVIEVKKKEVVPVKVRKKVPKVQPNKYDINFDVYGNQVGETRK